MLYDNIVYMRDWSVLVENQQPISLFCRWIHFYIEVDEKVYIWEMIFLAIKKWQNQTILAKREITSSVKEYIHNSLNHNCSYK